MAAKLAAGRLRRRSVLDWFDQGSGITVANKPRQRWVQVVGRLQGLGRGWRRTGEGAAAGQSTPALRTGEQERVQAVQMGVARSRRAGGGPGLAPGFLLPPEQEGLGARFLFFFCT